MDILHFKYLEDTVSFGWEYSCSSARRVSNVNSNVHVPQGVPTLLQS